MRVRFLSCMLLTVSAFALTSCQEKKAEEGQVVTEGASVEVRDNHDLMLDPKVKEISKEAEKMADRVSDVVQDASSTVGNASHRAKEAGSEAAEESMSNINHAEPPPKP